jgi:hypothetical protein
MVEVGDDPAQVADAVAVAVGERTRVDLVDRAALPPRRLRHGISLGRSCDTASYERNVAPRGGRHER